MKRTLGFAAGVAGACLAYGTFVEPLDFRIRTAKATVLPRDAEPVVVLHLSDAHLVETQRAKLDFLRMLELLEPDLVVMTGDNLASAAALDPYLEALGGLFEMPGVFVFGSNDYHGPRLTNPLAYLWRSSGGSKLPLSGPAAELPWQDLAAAFTARGWVNLMERRLELTINGNLLEFRGTSDAHIDLDDYSVVAGPVPTGAIGIGVTHAPYSRVLDPMVADGLSLIFAGHTHGGQVCVPGFGALTTNCDLPVGQAKGLSRLSTGGRSSWLQVSGGLGASPWAPFRFANPPEVTLVTLAPRS